MEELRTTVLVLATMTTGMTAGVFALYANAIMPGLRATDDRTFVGAFQAIDRAIINPVWLVGGFLGVLLLTGAAAGLHLDPSRRSVLVWVCLAFVLHAVVVAVTLVVNVPRNDALKAAGDPATVDVAAVRRAFSESGWVAWNAVRVALDVAALAAMCLALVAHGRLLG